MTRNSDQHDDPGVDGQPDPQAGSQPSGDEGGSAGQSSDEPGVIEDEQLPEDLQPTDDNPLAKNPEEEDEDGGGHPPSQAGGPGPDSPGTGQPGAAS